LGRPVRTRRNREEDWELVKVMVRLVLALGISSSVCQEEVMFREGVTAIL
jgi:hypothetical protein